MYAGKLSQQNGGIPLIYPPTMRRCHKKTTTDGNTKNNIALSSRTSYVVSNSISEIRYNHVHPFFSMLPLLLLLLGEPAAAIVVSDNGVDSFKTSGSNNSIIGHQLSTAVLFLICI
ncbi:MAG: hypothetical protein ACI8RD_008838 [Bacillariaceae sp.]|jgi:hypothetical protein